jgi:general secretion pathway protein F
VMAPAIAPLFQGQNRPMPLVLGIATGTTRLVSEHGLMIGVAVLCLAASLLVLVRTERFRRRRDALLLRLPLIGDLARRAAAARFARSFGTLLRGGAPVVQALSVTADTAGNRIVRAALAEAVESLRRGARLAEVLGGLAFLPEASRSLILAGERTNRLAEMLTRIAEMNERDLGQGIDRLMTILTPALTVAIGGLVGGLILSVMSAILSTNDLAF